MPEEREDQHIIVDRGGGQLTAFVIGLLVGAGTALLLAPKSGAETRAEIARQVRRAKRVGAQFADDVRDQGRAAAHAARAELRRRLAERDEPGGDAEPT